MPDGIDPKMFLTSSTMMHVVFEEYAMPKMIYWPILYVQKLCKDTPGVRKRLHLTEISGYYWTGSNET